MDRLCRRRHDGWVYDKAVTGFVLARTKGMHGGARQSEVGDGRRGLWDRDGQDGVSWSQLYFGE